MAVERLTVDAEERLPFGEGSILTSEVGTVGGKLCRRFDFTGRAPAPVLSGTEVDFDIFLCFLELESKSRCCCLMIFSLASSFMRSFDDLLVSIFYGILDVPTENNQNIYFIL